MKRTTPKSIVAPNRIRNAARPAASTGASSAARSRSVVVASAFIRDSQAQDADELGLQDIGKELQGRMRGDDAVAVARQGRREAAVDRRRSVDRALERRRHRGR